MVDHEFNMFAVSDHLLLNGCMVFDHGHIKSGGGSATGLCFGSLVLEATTSDKLKVFFAASISCPVLDNELMYAVYS